MTKMATQLESNNMKPALVVDLQLGIDDLQQSYVPDAALIEQYACAVFTALELGSESTIPTELSVRIVDAAEMQQLNLQFRDKDSPTNVLSFPAGLDQKIAEELGAQLLGDLVICNCVVHKEAADQSKSVQDHYAHLVVHGVLHLLGYDHILEEQAQAMEALEVGILAQFNISNPYI